MRFRSTLLCGIFLLFLPGALSAETLTEQLAKENAEQLARDARSRGNAVRGALLFQQRKIECAKCHTSGSGENRIGPNLSKPEADATDAHVIESILAPSQKIRKGFELVSVELENGRLFSGQILEQTPQRLVLRDPATASNRIIAAGDVAEISPNKLSPMPDKLADQLADRQQFLDLVRYVLELGDSGGSDAAPGQHSIVRKPLRNDLQGRLLLGNFNCASCHTEGVHGEKLPTKQAPDLAWTAGNVDPYYIARFVADPHGTKPGTTMPNMLSALPPAEREATATQIAHFLAGRGERFERQLIDKASAERGRELFHTIGCAACHSPRDKDDVELLTDEPHNVPLGDVAAKYNWNGLVAFLQDPRAARPAGRMPKVPMTHWEARDLASYLLYDTEVAGNHKPFRVDAKLAAQGRQQFERHGCIDCHQGFERKLAQRHYTSLKTLDAQRGCLSGKAGEWPAYSLKPAELAAIRAALPSAHQELSTEDRIDLSLATLNCTACHQRGELGGPTQNRVQYFHTTNENLGEQGRLPPTLTGVGAKLKPAWLRDVLLNGRTIRPYMKTRMPQYGEKNVGHLIELLGNHDKLPPVTIPRPSDPKEFKRAGLEMAGSNGLNCIACHTYKHKKSDLMPAVDLTEMSDRLQPNWFYHYMRDPQRFSQNTVMPSFWPGGRAMRKDILKGETDAQIAALWTYLLDGRQGGTPRGVIREPLRLVVGKEAVMLRRSYGGIGKRGIGVGYPLGLNLTFDAEQLRLNSIWKGEFADPGSVFYGQGSGSVRTLGTDRISFPPGPEFDSAKQPWVYDKESRPPKHQFKGYYLDKLRRPTFMYQYDGIAVEDSWVDVTADESDTPVFRRTLTWNTDKPRDDVALRLAQDKQVVAADGHFAVGNTLQIHVVGKLQPKIITVENEKRLTLPLALPQGKTSVTLEYRW